MMSGGKRFASDVYDASGDFANKRPNTTSGPSAVLFVNNIPPDATDTDLATLAGNFGGAVKTLVLRGKGKGFLQLGSPQQAQQMLHYHTTTYPAYVRGFPVQLSFSNRSEITLGQGQLGNSSAVIGGGSSSSAPQGRVLHVVLSNVIHPIDVNIINQVFSSYGTVVRAVVFTREGVTQALVEFGDQQSAVNAQRLVHGTDIYPNCCTMSIDFSKMDQLTVKANNDRSRDFTNPNLPSSDPSHGGASSSSSAPPPPPSSNFHMQQPSGFGASGGFSQQMPMGMGMGMGGQMMGQPFQQQQHQQQPMMMMGGGAGMGMGGGSPVILVNGIPEHSPISDVNGLFKLFSAYGDVIRVKILFNKRSSGLIEYTDPMGARMAIMHLNGATVYGSTLVVVPSKTLQVKMPRSMDESGEILNGEFISSPFHRFRSPTSKRYNHLCGPRDVLHLSNIPEAVTQDELVRLLSTVGTVEGFKFFEQNTMDKRMAFARMSDVSTAVTALVLLHGHSFEGYKNRLQISFSDTKKMEGVTLDGATPGVYGSASGVSASSSSSSSAAAPGGSAAPPGVTATAETAQDQNEEVAEEEEKNEE